MFGAGFAKAVAGTGASPSATERNSVIARELDSAAFEGDDARVKLLLEQLLSSSTRRAGGKLRDQLAAIEDLFYAMRTAADTDQLTGLYNRRGFECRAARLLRSLVRERRGAVLVYVDVDDLKVVNDSLGHGAGDRLLTAATRALRSACGEGVIIGRIGGAEFAVLARETADGTYEQIRQKIRGAVAVYNAAGELPSLSISLGVADFDPLRPASIASLIDRADRAMYLEKFRKAPALPMSAAVPTPAEEATPVNRARAALGEVQC